MTTDVERDLSHIVRQDEGEDRQAFLLRAIKELDKRSDDEWDGLQDATQKWFNKAADVWNSSYVGQRGKRLPLPDFPGRAT